MTERDSGPRLQVNFVQDGFDGVSRMDELVGEDPAVPRNRVAESLFEGSSYGSGHRRRHKAKALYNGQEFSSSPTVG